MESIWRGVRVWGGRQGVQSGVPLGTREWRTPLAGPRTLSSVIHACDSASSASSHAVMRAARASFARCTFACACIARSAFVSRFRRIAPRCLIARSSFRRARSARFSALACSTFARNSSSLAAIAASAASTSALMRALAEPGRGEETVCLEQLHLRPTPTRAPCLGEQFLVLDTLLNEFEWPLGHWAKLEQRSRGVANDDAETLGLHVGVTGCGARHGVCNRSRRPPQRTSSFRKVCGARMPWFFLMYRLCKREE